MGTATRIYWTFKVLGHDKVSILNSGMAAYKKAKKPEFPIETVPNSLQPKTFQANFKKEWVLSRDQVRQAFDNGDVFLDSRTDDQFMGLNKHAQSKSFRNHTGLHQCPPRLADPWRKRDLP